MSDIAISVDSLSKKYQIGRAREHHDTLREALSAGLRAPLQRLRRVSTQPEDDTFWALKDVSFEVKRGEVIGIIGRNGAGKSTLLKILGHITEPTYGRAILNGRVASLLEVGTGFHPELTGRENIYLSGAILGMRRLEIDRKFDEIVAFSSVEKFIDTPVKRFSSGMKVRLGFAVAAHLEPEILLIDEVLAVGDAEFQKRSLGKMEHVAKAGRTVLFVSHQMNAVRSMCEKSLLIEEGNLKAFDSSDSVISQYVQQDASRSEWLAEASRTPPTNPYFTPLRFAIVDRDLKPLNREIRADEQFGVVIEGVTEVTNSALTAGFAVYAITGELLFWSLHTDIQQSEWPSIKPGMNSLVCWIPPHLLNEGDYRIDLALSIHYTQWLCKPLVNSPSIQVKIRGGLSESPYWMMKRPGLLGVVLPFHRLE